MVVAFSPVLDDVEITWDCCWDPELGIIRGCVRKNRRKTLNEPRIHLMGQRFGLWDIYSIEMAIIVRINGMPYANCKAARYVASSKDTSGFVKIKNENPINMTTVSGLRASPDSRSMRRGRVKRTLDQRLNGQRTRTMKTSALCTDLYSLSRDYRS